LSVPTVRHEDCARVLVLTGTVARFGRLDAASDNAVHRRPTLARSPRSRPTATRTFDQWFARHAPQHKARLRLMQAPSSGSIINISSTEGYAISVRDARRSIRSKHAVEGLTSLPLLKLRDRECDQAIGTRDATRIAILTASPAAPNERPALWHVFPPACSGYPDEIAKHRLLASYKSSFTTGQCSSVYGGKSAT